MKCGTSSLHYYLGQHPEIEMSQPKELHFFIDKSGFDPGPFIEHPRETRTLGGDANWCRGVDWYAQHFSPKAPIRGESTVAYGFPWFRGVPERMAAVIPEAKLIYLMRNPVDRMVSHFLDYREAGRDGRPIDDALGASNNQYLAATRYRSILDAFLGRFSRPQLLLVQQDELLKRRADTLRNVFRFLEVDETYWTPEMETLRNRRASKGAAYRLAARAARRPVARPLVGRMPTAVKARAERLLSARRAITARPELSPEVEVALLQDLEPEIAGIEELTGWNLRDWRSPRGGIWTAAERRSR